MTRIIWDATYTKQVGKMALVVDLACNRGPLSPQRTQPSHTPGTKRLLGSARLTVKQRLPATATRRRAASVGLKRGTKRLLGSARLIVKQRLPATATRRRAASVGLKRGTKRLLSGIMIAEQRLPATATRRADLVGLEGLASSVTTGGLCIELVVHVVVARRFRGCPSLDRGGDFTRRRRLSSKGLLGKAFVRVLLCANATVATR